MFYFIILNSIVFLNLAYADVTQQTTYNNANGAIVIICEKFPRMQLQNNANRPPVTPQLCLESAKPSYLRLGCKDLQNGTCKDIAQNKLECTLQSSNCMQPNANTQTCAQTGYTYKSKEKNLEEFSINLELCIK